MDIVDLLDERDKAQKKRTKRALNPEKPVKTKKLCKREIQIMEIANSTVLPAHYSTIWTLEALVEAVSFLSGVEYVAIDTETTGLDTFKDRIVGISLYAPHRGFYIPLRHEDPAVRCLATEVVVGVLKPLLENNESKFILHNAKFDMHVIKNNLGIVVRPYYDVMIGQALLDENQSKRLKDMAQFYLKIPADKYSTLFGKVTFDKVPIKLNEDTGTGNLATYYAVKDAELTYQLFEFQLKHLNNPSLAAIRSLLFDLEMPFLQIVAAAEQHGVRVDVDYLINDVAKTLHADVESLRQRIWAHTGQINLNSPPQVSAALYDRLGLPRVNTDKPNSTDKKTLKKLRKAHEVAPLLLEYREKTKLTTAFADKLPKRIVGGRIHPTFNSVGTKTGRMSCSSPNLQQVPVKTGALIRNAFVADEGRLLASIDFSQQELRVLTHVSGDDTLLHIYKNNLDVHSMTAVGIWNRQNPSHMVTIDDFEYLRSMCGHFLTENKTVDAKKIHDGAYVSSLFEGGKVRSRDPEVLMVEVGQGVLAEKTRTSAKVVNFGIIYGMSEKGLADTLEISEAEAKEYIAGYFDAYPQVRKWMERQREAMRKHMFTSTLLGRKRRVYPEMRSGERWKIEKGFRMGINADIQGSSADMVKLASIKLQPLLQELDSRILLWVHDEIIFDVPEDIGMHNLRRIADVMCNALQLVTGMKSDIEAGKKWGQRMSDDAIARLAAHLEDEEDDDEAGDDADES